MTIERKNIMTSKTIKTVLFAGLIMTLMVPVFSMNSAEAENEKQSKDNLKKNIKDWILNEKKDKKTAKDKTAEIKTKYENLLRESIEEIRIQSNTTELTEDEIQDAINYIIIETIKDEKLKLKEKNKNPEEIYFDALSLLGIQYVDASCPSTTHPKYKQVSIDINGGSYSGYSFDGDNDLFGVTYSDNSSTCVRTYTLYFQDEDHPYLDAFYDQLRISWYQRIMDIESFEIKNNNQITFDNTYSSYQDFDCLSSSIVGCHYSGTKTYNPGSTIYVSNTWNHMMNTYDTNPSLSEVYVP